MPLRCKPSGPGCWMLVIPHVCIQASTYVRNKEGWIVEITRVMLHIYTILCPCLTMFIKFIIICIGYIEVNFHSSLYSVCYNTYSFFKLENNQKLKLKINKVE